MFTDRDFIKNVAQLAEEAQQRRLEEQADPVEQFFNSVVPQTLWHYTRVPNFEAILASGRMWATEARHTSDTTEFIYAKEIALTYLRDFQPSTKAEALARRSCLQILEDDFENGTLSTQGTEVFLLSFSAAKDLKSQWNEYADNGSGVSIAFDLRACRPPLTASVAVTLAPCIYERTSSEWLIRTAVGHLIKGTERLSTRSRDQTWYSHTLAEWKRVDRAQGVAFDQGAFQSSLERLFNADLRTAAALMKYDLLRVSAHCKNPFYLEEREWRLALPHTKGKPLVDNLIEYRGQQSHIPYVAHDLFSGGLLPVTEVMLGPSCDEEQVVSNALLSHGYDVPISKSRSPQRRPGTK